MGKQKTLWACTECGHNQHKWTGQCSQCQKWNTFLEEVDASAVKSRYDTTQVQNTKPVRISEVSADETPRFTTGLCEFDRLMGGGSLKDLSH